MTQKNNKKNGKKRRSVKNCLVGLWKNSLTSIPAKRPRTPRAAIICFVVSIIPKGRSDVCMVDFTTSGAMDTIQPIWPARLIIEKEYGGNSEWKIEWFSERDGETDRQ